MKIYSRGSVIVAWILGAAINTGFAEAAELKERILFTEFFEELYVSDLTGNSINPANFDRSSTGILGEVIIESAGTVLVSDFSNLRRINLASGHVDRVGMLPEHAISGLALEADGTILATAADGIYTIDPITGAAASRVEQDFFSPSHVTVTSDGDIYITEFFEGLLRLDPVTYQPNPVALEAPFGSIAQQIQALPNNELAVYLLDGSLVRIDPDAGSITEITGSLSDAHVGGLGIDSSGNLLVATSEEVFSINPFTAERETIAQTGPFFSPHDVASGFVLVPEPTAFMLCLSLAGLVAARRRA